MTQQYRRMSEVERLTFHFVAASPDNLLEHDSQFSMPKVSSAVACLRTSSSCRPPNQLETQRFWEFLGGGKIPGFHLVPSHTLRQTSTAYPAFQSFRKSFLGESVLLIRPMFHNPYRISRFEEVDFKGTVGNHSFIFMAFDPICVPARRIQVRFIIFAQEPRL